MEDGFSIVLRVRDEQVTGRTTEILDLAVMTSPLLLHEIAGKVVRQALACWLIADQRRGRHPSSPLPESAVEIVGRPKPQDLRKEVFVIHQCPRGHVV